MTNKVVYKTLNIFHMKKKIFREKNLNFISSFIIFDLSDTFLVNQNKSRKVVSFIRILTFFKKGIV